MLAREYWFDWMDIKDYGRFPDLDSYVEYRVEKENRFTNREEAITGYAIEYCKRLIQYDHQKFGDYPEILKERLSNPKYKIVYNDQEIIGRNDILN
jgi:hypothetical protein